MLAASSSRSGHYFQLRHRPNEATRWLLRPYVVRCRGLHTMLYFRNKVNTVVVVPIISPQSPSSTQRCLSLRVERAIAGWYLRVLVQGLTFTIHRQNQVLRRLCEELRVLF